MNGKWFLSGKGVASGCAVVVGIYAAAGVLGADLPRPAWSTEIKAIRTEIAGAKAERIAIQRAILRGHLFYARVEATKLKQQNKPVPQWLSLRLLELESKLRDMELRRNGRR